MAIPVVIHLLMRRRRKPVRWAAMRFLIEAYRRQRRRVRLEQLLLLSARCLLVALVALAVARPMFGDSGAGGGGPRELYLLVDNGIASALTGADGRTELERSIERALARLDSLESARGDRAALIALGGPAQALVLPPTSDLALVGRKLRELDPTDSRMDLAGGLGLAAAQAAGRGGERAPGNESERVVAVCSGFREGSVGRGATLPALPRAARLFAEPPSEEALSNIGIESVSLLRPLVLTGAGDAGTSQMRVRLVRSGLSADRAEVTTIRVLSDSGESAELVGRGEVRWEAGQVEATATVDVDASRLREEVGSVLRAEIDRDADERDNRAWATVSVREKLRVAVVGTRRFGPRPRISDFGPSDWLELAIAPAGQGQGSEIGVEVVDAARLAGPDLAGFDAVVVAEPDRVRAEGWDALGAFVSRGGAVVLFAGLTTGAQLWVQPASRALGLDWVIDREPTEIEATEGALVAPGARDSDLLWFLRGELETLAAMVRVERVLGVQGDADVVLATGDGHPVLLVRRGGEGVERSRSGVVAMFTVALGLSWTDLPARPLMVPLVQELLRGSAGRGGAMRAATTGARLQAAAGAVELRGLTGEVRGRSWGVDPSIGLTRAPVREAGVFEARDASGVRVGVLAVAPDAAGAAAGAVGRERVGAWLASATPGGLGVGWEGEARGTRQGEARRRASTDPGPGLVLLLAALLLACVELCLARLFSHAAREGGLAREGAA